MAKRKCPLFPENIYDEVPVFYRFLRKTSKAQTDEIELGDMNISSSALHRSSTYFIYENYTPYTKFNVFKKLIR